MKPLKYSSNFQGNLEIPLINCEINIMVIWSTNCFLFAGTAANQVPTFTITDTKVSCFSSNFSRGKVWTLEHISRGTILISV